MNVLVYLLCREVSELCFVSSPVTSIEDWMENEENVLIKCTVNKLLL